MVAEAFCSLKNLSTNSTSTGSVISLFLQGESRQWASLSGLRTARKLLTKVYYLF